MTSGERNSSLSLYRGVKVTLNTLADRVFEVCNKIIEDAYQFPWPAAQTVVEGVARFVGNMSRLFQEIPRRTAYKMTGSKWTIVYVGEEENIIGEIQHLFFAEEEVVPQKLGRVALWELSAQCERWWAEGADLVVGESSRISPYWPRAPFRFSMPSFIRQVLEMPDDLESLLAGGRLAAIRHNLNRAQKAKFFWYYSRSKEDFDLFYHNMYVPYIKERHGSRSRIASYDWLWQKFIRGGLIVVTQNNTRVGGNLCYLRDKACIAIDGGVLDSDPDLLQQGIIVSRDWFAMNWAHQQGARAFDLGNTRPWRSNGVFSYKSRWRTKAASARQIYGGWTFLAQDMPLALQQHINQIGFISEVKGKFFATLLDNDQSPLSTSEIDQQLSTVQGQGLDGLLVVSANRWRVIPVANSTAR